MLQHRSIGVLQEYTMLLPTSEVALGPEYNRALLWGDCTLALDTFCTETKRTIHMERCMKQNQNELTNAR